MLGPHDVLGVLPVLAAERPVFHSEADFQHALAWALQRSRPELRVRLETRPRPGIHLDLLVADAAGGSALAVELKYLTNVWDGMVDGESFHLLRQAAQDIRAYDCVKDVGRIEQLVYQGHAAAGLVLVLSNEPSYWRAPSHGRATNAAAFRLHDDLLLTGPRAWGPLTGAGTSKGRTDAVILTGRYHLKWHDYSTVPGQRGRFRYLAITVP